MDYDKSIIKQGFYCPLYFILLSFTFKVFHIRLCDLCLDTTNRTCQCSLTLNFLQINHNNNNNKRAICAWTFISFVINIDYKKKTGLLKERKKTLTIIEQVIVQPCFVAQVSKGDPGGVWVKRNPNEKQHQTHPGRRVGSCNKDCTDITT